ncbi:MAG: hypothetical protein II738_06050 [Clostridia bacterium]|nr:hypothetical protein [Clostridia bacterium]
MKYKVSLLPELQRKRLDGKKKSEKIQVYALVAMLLLLAVLLIVIFSNFYAQRKLSSIQAENARYEQEIAELQQYRDLDAELQNKKQLINSIIIREPEMTNFIASLSNMKHTGISFTSIDCTDWQTSRICTLSGTAVSRDAYLGFEKALASVSGVTGVSNSSYVSGAGTENGLAEFTVVIDCADGSVAATPTLPDLTIPDVTLAEGEEVTVNVD